MKKATATKAKSTPATPAPVPEKKVTTPAKATAAAPVKASAKAATPAKAASPAKAKPPAKPKAAAPAVKAAAAASLATTITAQINVGFGNALAVRGEGPGLSWEKGVLMDCVADDKWSLTLADAETPVVFKFLLNDTSWSSGDDFIVAPGSTISLTPTF